MFFSDSLLSRNGALGRVWLAANMERKLTKNDVLHTKLRDKVSTILGQDGPPLALRLSGQLLIGVVRIYNKKTRYLYDDCVEALQKIKMAFKPGNVNLAANETYTADPKSLTLRDQLTDMDLLAPPPDPNLLLSQLELDNLGPAPEPNFMNYSQLLSGSIEQPRGDVEEPLGLVDEIDDLDLGQDDFLEGNTTGLYNEGTSIEQPRDAPLQRSASEEFAASPKPFEDDNTMLNMGGDDLLGEDTSLFPAFEHHDPETPQFPDLDRRQRDTLSPLSSIRSSVDRELDKTVQGDPNSTTFEPQDEEDETIHQQPHRAKRRKVLQADADTELHSTQIRAQQNDRSKILKTASFLPRDPMLLALMTMQKTGGFVSSILGEGRSRGWAPELRGILSLEVVKRSGELKRKRKGEDDGPVDINLDANDETIVGLNDSVQYGTNHDIIELPEDAGAPPPLGLDEDNALSPIPDNFDDTTVPLVYPADSGPISLGTKDAVHLLREKFGPAATESESQRLKSSVVFQDWLPEHVTTKADATKMFYQMLILVTKDAIKVEQSPEELGGPIQLRAKRGLWGAWAEDQAGGEIAAEVEAAA